MKKQSAYARKRARMSEWQRVRAPGNMDNSSTTVVQQPVAFREIADCMTAAYGTKWNGNASATNGSLFALQARQSGGDTAYSTKLHNTTSNNAGKIFEERTASLDANSPPPALLTAMQVRRLTPVECERLQGFPDNYTAIPWRKKAADQCPDGPRYKALGNSWAVPVVAWIGQRINRAMQELA